MKYKNSSMLDAELISYYIDIYGIDSEPPVQKGRVMKQEGRDNFARLYDLLTLINDLRNSRAGLTYDYIQDKLECSRRTAERMIAIIENHYYNFRKERRRVDNKIYFRLLPDDDLPPNSISEDEVVALRTAIGFVKNNDPLKLPLESLAGKLQAMKGGGASGNIEDMTLACGTASAPRPRIQCDRGIIEALQKAILSYSIVKIKYQKTDSGAAASHTICPLGFLYGIQNNYLVACAEGRSDRPKHYTLGRIQSVTLTKTEFDAQEFDIREYAKKSFGSWIAHDGGYKVKWKVSPKAAKTAKRFEFHPTQKMKEMADGSLTVEFVADGLKEMAWHLMTWEGAIKPIAPKELVEEYEKQLELAAGALK